MVGQPTGAMCVADHGPARRIRIVIGGAQKCAGSGTEDGRGGSFLIELALIAGERLTGGQVGLEGDRGRTVQYRRVICTTVGAGSDKDG
jgi:hypothetical protein